MAIFNLQYICEASKEDADRLEDKGREESDLRKGSRIVDHTLRKPIKLRNGSVIGDQEEYDKKYKIKDIDKFNNDKEKSREKLIKDAVKKSDFIRTSDSSKEAIKQQENKNRYKDIDINKSLKGIPEDKAKHIKRQLEKGGNLPESISSKLIKKKDIEIDPESCKRHGSYFEKTFTKDEEDIKDELKSLYKTMDKSNNYDEYKKAYDKFTKITGYKDADHISQIRFQNNTLSFNTTMSKDDEEKAGDSKYFHTSTADNIKKLYPTFKSTDDVFYKTPRVYFNKDVSGSRMGGTGSDGYKTYHTKFDKDSTVKIDSELRGGPARYKETKRAIKVDKD